MSTKVAPIVGGLLNVPDLVHNLYFPSSAHQLTGLFICYIVPNHAILKLQICCKQQFIAQMLVRRLLYHLGYLLCPLTLPLVLSAAAESQTKFLLSPPNLEPEFRIPTRYESTVLARRLLALSPFGAISTVFPPDHDRQRRARRRSGGATLPPVPLSYPPSSLSHIPIALPEYISSCEEPSGNPSLLLLDVSTPSRNLRASQNHNISLSISWWSQYAALTGHPSASPASLPRLSLLGYAEEIPIAEAQEKGIVDCYLSAHPDAGFWLPGRKGSPHTGRWYRMVVEEVYWIGGFGDRAYIGWFDREEWKRVAREEWEAVRLPGEKD